MGQTFLDYFWLCFTALVAGGINALAGGGTLLTFPALTGVLSQAHDEAIAAMLANGTNTVALVPASFGSSWGFRRETYELRTLLLWLIPPSILGSIIGALLLVMFPKQFSDLIPWLLLAATLLLLIQPYVTRRLTAASRYSDVHVAAGGSIPFRSLVGMMLLQLVISIYGGYFGAGIGILMLSGLGMMGLTNVHQMNGLKSSLAAAINGVAAIIFIALNKVVWPYALAMMAASLVGGFFVAHYGRHIPAPYVRWFVVIIGFLLSAWYFAKTHII